MSRTFEVVHLGTDFNKEATAKGDLNIAVDVWP